MKHISNEATQNAILHGPNGSSWQVKLSKTPMGNFLSDGWSNVVEDQCLKEEEFLLFRYDGNMHFHVMIFDTSACEREDVFEMKSIQKSECERINKRGRPRKHPLDANCILQHQSGRSKLLEFSSDNKHTSKRLRGKHLSAKSTGNARNTTEDVHLPSHKLPLQNSYLSRSRSVPIEEKSKAEEAANSFYSPFPYAIIRMRKYELCVKHSVRFRVGFSMHLPLEKTELVLRDPSGKAWTVLYIPCRREVILSRGWKAFATGNNIEEGDFCVFELIGELQLRVHIFRVAGETTPSAPLAVKSS